MHGQLLRLHHGSQAHRISHGIFAGQASQHLLRLKGIDGDDVLHANGADRLIRKISHDLANLLEHSAYVGPGFSVNLFQRTNTRQLRHDGVGAFVDRHLRFLLMTDQGDFAGRDPPLFDVSLRCLDDDGTARTHERSRHGHNALGLLRFEVKKGCDVVRIAELLDSASWPGDFDGRRHSQRHTVDILHLIYDRHRLFQPVVDEHSIIFLNDGSGNADTTRTCRVDLRRCIFEFDRAGYDHDPGLVIWTGASQFMQANRETLSQSLPSRSGGVMADHGRLGDHRLGDRFHGNIADDGCRLIQQHHVELVTRQVCNFQGLIKRIDDAHGITQRALNPNRSGHGTGQKSGVALAIDFCHCHFRRVISNINTSYVSHIGQLGITS